MNFKKLQAMQAKLDEAILADKAPMTAEGRFNKTLVALSVEIAEVANTVEHFKFWKDNKGKIDESRFQWHGELMDISLGDRDKLVDLRNRMKEVSPKQAHRLTLIEECSDALHFILSLANQANKELVGFNLVPFETTKEEKYITIQSTIGSLVTSYGRDKQVDLEYLMDYFYDYVESLGITPQELEQAYYDKNKINYERLENGY
ncbi:dUTP diphosphatase [Jeotgalibaca porci]|uniref:dUTP diphosphatase n=1 Tax=Jeotgalibaca porci TaxID=1868793 RepID=UPI0035A1D36E